MAHSFRPNKWPPDFLGALSSQILRRFYIFYFPCYKNRLKNAATLEASQGKSKGWNMADYWQTTRTRQQGLWNPPRDPWHQRSEHSSLLHWAWKSNLQNYHIWLITPVLLLHDLRNISESPGQSAMLMWPHYIDIPISQCLWQLFYQTIKPLQCRMVPNQGSQWARDISQR